MQRLTITHSEVCKETCQIRRWGHHVWAETPENRSKAVIKDFSLEGLLVWTGGDRLEDLGVIMRVDERWADRVWL